jgi:Fe-S-cluster containining protein
MTSPGWFVPEEIPRLAKHLGMSVEETFQRYLALGAVMMPDGTIRRGVMPHKLKDHKKPGASWSLGEMAADGRCVFFDRGRCTIHAVRPFECARATHGSMKRAMTLRHHAAEAWTREELGHFSQLCRPSRDRRR